jgi:hypothetical protein
MFFHFVHLTTNDTGIRTIVVSDPAISEHIRAIMGYEDIYDVVNLLLKELYQLCELNQLDLEPYIQEAHRIRYNQSMIAPTLSKNDGSPD